MTGLPEKGISPERLFFKIGEISDIAELEPHVLRYWESEFNFLKPRKNKTGQRVYTRKDLELVLQIKILLYKEKYTIAGVKKKFGERSFKKTSGSMKTIQDVREKLKGILDTFNKTDSRRKVPVTKKNPGNKKKNNNETQMQLL